MKKVFAHPYAPLAAFGILVVVMLFIFNHDTSRINKSLVIVQKNYQKIAALQRTQEQSQIKACHRLNLLRASDNVSHYADYRFFTHTTNLLKVAAIGIKNPTKKKQTLDYVDKLEQYAKAKSWGELARCNSATTNPTGFKIPPSVPFYKHLPPKHPSVFKLGPGE